MQAHVERKGPEDGGGPQRFRIVSDHRGDAAWSRDFPGGDERSGSEDSCLTSSPGTHGGACFGEGQLLDPGQGDVEREAGCHKVNGYPGHGLKVFLDGGGSNVVAGIPGAPKGFAQKPIRVSMRDGLAPAARSRVPGNARPRGAHRLWRAGGGHRGGRQRRREPSPAIGISVHASLQRTPARGGRPAPRPRPTTVARKKRKSAVQTSPPSGDSTNISKYAPNPRPHHDSETASLPAAARRWAAGDDDPVRRLPRHRSIPVGAGSLTDRAVRISLRP